MLIHFLRKLGVPLAGILVCASAAAAAVPSPALDEPTAKASGSETSVLAGGCFWGLQLVYEHVKGVKSVSAGYSGGDASTADYESVSTGKTGHAESVSITFDPSQISYGQILRIFFSVAHNPTELNQQGPDIGTQYRSAIFYSSPEQERIARAYITQLNSAKVFPKEIVTQVAPLKKFYPAEAYHQDYAVHHPGDPYIMINDAPKVKNLRNEFPDIYTGK